MREPFTRRLADSSFCVKCASYWQSVLRFGLPWAVAYGGIDYAVFRLSAHNIGLRYPWRLTAIADISVMFVVAAMWWLLMREIAAWRRKSQQGR